MRFAQVKGLLGKQRGVNAAVDHPGAPRPRHAPHFIAAQCVAGVNADADNVAACDALRLNLLQRFVDQHGIARNRRGGRRQHKQPSRRDDRRPERIVAWIDQMNAHLSQPSLVRARCMGLLP